MKRLIASSLLSFGLLSAGASQAQDFDGDGLNDLNLYDASRAVFQTRFSTTGAQQEHALGGTGDLPLHGDFLGTNVSGLATFDRTTGRWVFKRSNGTTGSLTFFNDPGDLPVMGHFRGAACEEYGTYTPRTAEWTISNCSAPTHDTVTFGDTGAIPVVCDWNGDGTTDLGTFDRENNRWVVGGGVSGSPSAATTVTFGAFGDIPVPADYDGDGRCDFAVFRPSESKFHVYDTETLGTTSVAYGLLGDVPLGMKIGVAGSVETVPANQVVFRPKTGNYYARINGSFSFNDIFFPKFKTNASSDGISPSPSGSVALPIQLNTYAYGVVPGDLNRNLHSDLIFVRSAAGLNEFSALDPDGTSSSTRFGFPTDTILMGDTDGDMRFEPTVVRKRSDNALDWYTRNINGFAIASMFGVFGDTPFMGDLDCDGKDDLVVTRKRAGEIDWYVKQTTGGLVGPIPFGLQNDKPFVADITGDGCEDMLVAQRVLGGIFWFTRDYKTGTVTNVQWGLDSTGDSELPPADYDGDGRADLTVVRTAGGQKTAFMRLATGSSRTLALGDSGLVPFIGNFSGINKSDIATYDSSAGNVKIVRFDGTISNVKVANAAGADKLMMPYGTPVAISGGTGGGDGGGSGGAANCTSTIRIQSAPGGFVWKPKSDSDGKLAVVMEPSLMSTTAALYSPTGTFLENSRYTGEHNPILGNPRSHHRFSKPGGSYAPGTMFRDGASGRCVIVSPTNIRHG